MCSRTGVRTCSVSTTRKETVCVCPLSEKTCFSVSTARRNAGCVSDTPSRPHHGDGLERDLAPLAQSQSIRAHQFASPGLFPAPKWTDLYRMPSMSTFK